MTPEDPPGFVVRTEAGKAAYARGYRLERGMDGPWLRYASASVPGEVWIAGCGLAGPWLLAVGHPGVAAELGPAAGVPGLGARRFAHASFGALYATLDRTWRHAGSLSTAPLAEFQRRAAGLPRAMEAERLAVQRIGQDVFRRALMEY